MGASPPSPDHRCSPALAKRAVLDFCRLEIGFFLQNDPLAAEAMRRVATLDQRPDPQLPLAQRECADPGIASVCWRLERAWRLIETDEDDCAELHRALRQTTEQLYAPIEQIGESARRSAAGQFPFSWIPRYSTNACAFKHFDSGAAQCQQPALFGSESGHGRALPIRHARRRRFLHRLRALILENGRRGGGDARRLCGRLQQAMR